VEVVKFASAHDLRRSFGERWASRLMPKDLMVLMRHENFNTTLKFYAGRNAEKTADAAWAAYEAAQARQQAGKKTGPVNTFVNSQPPSGPRGRGKKRHKPLFCKGLWSGGQRARTVDLLNAIQIQGGMDRLNFSLIIVDRPRVFPYNHA
jgi:hypothetical protein